MIDLLTLHTRRAVREHAEHNGIDVSEVDEFTRGIITVCLLQHGDPDLVFEYLFGERVHEDPESP